MTAGLTAAVVEDAALAWLETLSWTIAHGPDIAPSAATEERTDYGQVILEQRLRDALARLNPSLPADALDDAFRKLTHSVGATLEARSRTFHQMLVDGVTVEYQAADGSIRGMQAQVIGDGFLSRRSLNKLPKFGSGELRVRENVQKGRYEQ